MPASDVGRERRAHQRQVRRCEVALALVGEQTLSVENSLLDRQPMQFVTDVWCLCNDGVTGYAAGRHHARNGGGTNQLCLPEEPQLENHTKPGVLTGWLYGTEYSVNSVKYPTGATAYHGKPTPCAVCYVPQRSAQLMIPASNECPVGWTREYDGYLMSGYSLPVGSAVRYHHGTSYICVDAAPDVASGPVRQYQSFLYFTRVGCGSLPCSVFHNGWNLPCVLCVK